MGQKLECALYMGEHITHGKIRYMLILSFLLNLLGWHWWIKLHRFQMYLYSFIIHHLYIPLCVHLPKSSFLPSPLTPLYLLLPSPTPFPILQYPKPNLLTTDWVSAKVKTYVTHWRKTVNTMGHFLKLILSAARNCWEPLLLEVF